MFKIESYVTPILLSYVDKYVRDFKPADAQVSLWGGGVTLHNLVLKADVLQQEVALPFTLVSGRIHELLIHVPWTKIMSEPIVVTINTIECVLSLHPPTSSDETPQSEVSSGRTQVVEAPPGYMQALVRRIVSNIAVRVHSLIVKYVHDDVVLSLNVKRLAVDSVGPNWEPAFADIEQNEPAIRRLVRLDDLTLCLDKSDSDGKIRFYQEPLLYRCQLDLRVLTRLVSANTRRASSLSVQLRSKRLAWNVTSDQLILLLRLLRERPPVDLNTPPPAPKQSTAQVTPLHTTSGNAAEPARSESWSEWAWSWLPTWMDREGAEEAPALPAPIPFTFAAYFDDISLVFKVIEVESSSRKRSRGLLELTATHAAIKSSVCSPTMLRYKMGARTLTLLAHGRCICGHVDLGNTNKEPTIYLNKSDNHDENWTWPEEDVNEQHVETAVAADEDTPKTIIEQTGQAGESPTVSTKSDDNNEDDETKEEVDDFWQKMNPLIYFEYSHDRAPPDELINPYDNPPLDYQYSDWEENSNVKISLQPMTLHVSTSLIHRLTVLRTVFQELPQAVVPDIPMRTLTVEECDALSENLPMRRVEIEVQDLRLRLYPFDHSLVERPAQPPFMLDIDLNKVTTTITGPLYPHRVCAAACQIPEDDGPLGQAARLRISVKASSIQAQLFSPADAVPRPCAHVDMRLNMHILLNKEYFTGMDNVVFSYALKIRELNAYGSSARMQAATEVLLSLLNEKTSVKLCHTTLVKNALNDEELVAMDVSLTGMDLRGYLTKNIRKHKITMRSAQATAYHEPKGAQLKLTWIFSAPDGKLITDPCLRVSVQWCLEMTANSLDYVDVKLEPCAICVDPLLIAWLAYRPRVLSSPESQSSTANVRAMASSQYFIRRRETPPSSSGRGGSRSGSGADLVHVRPRSVGSNSEPEKKDTKSQYQVPKTPEAWLSFEKIVQIEQRMRRMLVFAEIGTVLLYVTASAASAIDSASVRDAMERHATTTHRVVVFSLGYWAIESSSLRKDLLQEIRKDRPTILSPDQAPSDDGLPWKMCLSGVTCYTLKIKDTESGKSISGRRGQIKSTQNVLPRSILEMVTTTVTLSLSTKTTPVKSPKKNTEEKKPAKVTPEEERMKFFTAGVDFKPSSLKEFVRGPMRRRDKSPKQQPTEVPKAVPNTRSEPAISSDMPFMTCGVNIHADTPPIKVLLEHDQVHIVTVAIHCLMHIVTLLQRPPLMISKLTQTQPGPSASNRSLIRSASELDQQNQSDDTTSDNRSEKLIQIFEVAPPPSKEKKMKIFFWFQWVISQVSLNIISGKVKLVLEVEDIISSVDLQDHYKQMKIKMTSASFRHYEKSSIHELEWSTGVLGGRVVEAREPIDAKEENHFFTTTITQAQIANLPPNWKEELQLKMSERHYNTDTMWEVCATLAPLDVVMQPTILKHIVSCLRELTPRSFCSLPVEEQSSRHWHWPLVFVVIGRLRVLLTTDDNANSTVDDTFIIQIDKITSLPYPENPICRRAVNSGTEASWTRAGAVIEEPQYEVLIKDIAVSTAKFRQLVNQEIKETEMLNSTSGENPALKWSQPDVTPNITPVLHPLDVSCVLAPAVLKGNSVVYGHAFELNSLTDCVLEFTLHRIELARRLASDISRILENKVHDLEELDVDDENDVENHGVENSDDADVCPYASLIKQRPDHEDSVTGSDSSLSDEVTRSPTHGSNYAVDSGVDIATSFRPNCDYTHPKKHNVAFEDHAMISSHYLEVFVTMGTVEISLYEEDDESPEIVVLRPPPCEHEDTAEVAAGSAPTSNEPDADIEKIENKKEQESKEAHKQDDDQESPTGSKSLTETVREIDMGTIKLKTFNLARFSESNFPLLHVTLNQPNLYYWQQKTQKNVQLSVFNAWVGLGGGQKRWHLTLFNTASGPPDPVTDIPPALATLRMSQTSGGPRGTIQLDIERPVQFEVCTERLRRLKAIAALIEKKISRTPAPTNESEEFSLYNMRRAMVSRLLESITVQCIQTSVRGSEGTVGWGSCTMQVAAGSRPDRLVFRGLLSSLVAAVGSGSARRHIVLQPLMAGAMLEVSWDAWRRAEGGESARVPSVRASVDLDRVVCQLRPQDLETAARIWQVLTDYLDDLKVSTDIPEKSVPMKENSATSVKASTLNLQDASTCIDTDESEHYYKDDLRGGVFKMVTGGQLPLAYQVMLHGNVVSWRYPQPRTIVRLVVYPVPGLDEEIECALEVFCPMLGRWEPHTYFHLPVSEPRLLKFNVAPTDMVFAMTWRVRVCSDVQEEIPPFEFDSKKYMPRKNPLAPDIPLDFNNDESECKVSAEQLSGILRVDSYFAPRLLPRARLAFQLTALELFAYNSFPLGYRQSNSLGGYYSTRSLTRTHPVLLAAARDSTAHAIVGPGSKLLLNTNLSCDLLDISTNAMEHLVEEFRVQGAITTGGVEPRARIYAGDVRIALNVPFLRTLRSLVTDWQIAYEKHVSGAQTSEAVSEIKTRNIAAAAADALEGRVSLWLHNSCAVSLATAQDATEGTVTLAAGVSLAYKWRSPIAPKMLRFALAVPVDNNWHWSNSVPFVEGTYRIRLESAETKQGAYSTESGVFLYVKVVECGAKRDMYISGRLIFANMLHTNLLYRVRLRSDPDTTVDISTGELNMEKVGLSVPCEVDCEPTVKVKLANQVSEGGWSGDIPLKECPREKAPWLVKLPNVAEAGYMCVWCRIIRARNDARVIIAFWPLYILRSHLPLDTDVRITSDAGTLPPSSPEPSPVRLVPTTQTAPGRGTITHLKAPGTTSTRHSLTFRYRNLDCNVTREAVPLNYGVLESSVFDKPAPVACIDTVIREFNIWLERYGRDVKSDWPYSIVSGHWPGTWQPAQLQPRADVNIRYEAVRVCGGCCIELQLCSMVLFVNAAPIALTLRAYDASPLIKVEPGYAISPPITVIKREFLVSVEAGRETFVSGELRVSPEEPGRYAAPPPGRLVLDRPAHFTIHCNNKVALLTMFYEIKEEMNVLGVTSTYVLVNQLNTDLLVAAMAVPDEVSKDAVLRPVSFKVVRPTKDRRAHGTPLCRFWVRGRWRGGPAEELRAYVCLALASASQHPQDPVPVRLAEPPLRRAIALHDQNNASVPVVVTQLKHEGRWIITVAEDPCPQFVVYNHTRAPLVVAQSLRNDDDYNKTNISVLPECKGTKWWCVVGPEILTHYSSPVYCERYPPIAHATKPEITFLTVGKPREDLDPEWCRPIAAADGEHLLQLSGATIKLRVRTHPHSTLIELQDVDENDISASDIRRRLMSIEDYSEDNKSLASYTEKKVAGEDTKLLKPTQSLESMMSDDSRLPEGIKANLSLANAAILDNKEQTSKSDIADQETINSPSPTADAAELNDKETSLVASTSDLASGSKSSFLQEILGVDWSVKRSDERVRLVASSVVISMATSFDTLPLCALHFERAALIVKSDAKNIRSTLAIADVQVDNGRYETGQFDFAVVAATQTETRRQERWPPLWGMPSAAETFDTRENNASVLLRLCHDKWSVAQRNYTELTEVEVRVGPLLLYLEDAYISSAAGLAGMALGSPHEHDAAVETRTLQRPLRLRRLHLYPLDITLTLHTAIRMYIALDQSPLHLSAFQLDEMITSVDRLTHALTVHYLSAALLGAGWVVGGLELLGAPGAVAARVAGATGGVRGVASAAAAAALRSLSAAAASLARNLDLLAGDEDHARRAAAARRRPPPTFLQGLAAGVTNFAINILGAVGGLAHHPLVGVAVGESESSTTALRRGLVGAITKPLSATADLVAFAGQGLLTQTGWDPVPQSRWRARRVDRERFGHGYRQDCVRWMHRITELGVTAGFDVELNAARFRLLVAHKFLVLTDLDCERIVEMIHHRLCSLGPYDGLIVEIHVSQCRAQNASDIIYVDENLEYQMSASAMARVARYTGSHEPRDSRVLRFTPARSHSHALYAALAAALQHNADTHFPLL